MTQSEGHSATRRRSSEGAGKGPGMFSCDSLQSVGANMEAPVQCDSEEENEGKQEDMQADEQNNVAEGPREHAHQQEAPDGGWGWVVLVASVLVLALTLAFPSCLGIFYTDLQTDFQASNSETSWVPSIMTAVLHAGGPLCSVLVEQLGCRATVMLGGVLSGLGMAASSFTNTIVELYITAGIITGIGFCFSFQPAVTILGHYFHRRRAFANAVSSTGTAIGLSTLPFLADYLHSQLGWRGSFLVLGGVLLNCCVCGAVMRPVEPKYRTSQNPHANSDQPLQPKQDGLKGRVRASLANLMASLRRNMAFDLFCSNLRYRIYAIGITCMMLGFVVPLIFLVPYATSHGMEQSRAALLLAILGFVNIFVRPPVGLLFSMPWFQGRHIYVFSAALLVNGLSNSICCLAASFPVLLGYVVTYGLSMSIVGSLLFTVLMDIVEMSRFPAALGLLAIMESVTLLVGPPLAGTLVDRTGKYTYVFYACSAFVASSALFLMVSFYWLDRRERKAKRLSEPHAIPPKPGVTLALDCKYSSVPTQGGGAPNTETVYITAL
ncbi:monocarboxylate transporter 6-like [Megalops cyprinoides]|uniref:monocarboxylate transporter 6-like n=1 Tax=Megalops cyprinoides TaxID=118141 RepID=UPI001863A8B0|nr:monocarboxylate transporter 6-like [Megalops cyprinoides]XP_036397829.1 monocarboxylate transporter 6-like [Megalops cyprinoides]